MSSTTIRTTAIGVFASLALAGSLVAPPAASAQPKGGTAAKGCAVFHTGTDTSEEVPDGTLIIALSGTIYRCKNGEWVKVEAKVKSRAKLAVSSVSAKRATLR